MADLAASLPQLNVPCPRCESPAGALCTSHSGTRPRRNDVHRARTERWTAAGEPTTPEGEPEHD